MPILPPFTGTTAFIKDQAQALLTCLCTELDAFPDPPAECCVRVGSEVIHDMDPVTGVDKVCCPGLGYVRLGEMYPSSNFPEPDTLSYKCFPVAYAMTLYVGTVRCIPGMGSTSGPTCDDYETSFSHQANDMDAMIQALCCFQEQLNKARRGALVAIGSSFLESDGGCIEQYIPVAIQVPKCC